MIRITRRQFCGAGTALVGGWALVGCGGGGDGGTAGVGESFLPDPAGPARLRLFPAVDAAASSAFQLLFNGIPVIDAAAYGGEGLSDTLALGTATLTVVDTATGTTVATRTDTLASGTTSLFLYPSSTGNTAVLSAAANIGPASTTQSALRLVFLSRAAQAASVTVSLREISTLTDPSPIKEQKPGSVFSTQIKPGSYRVLVTAASDGATLLETDLVLPAPYRRYTLVFFGGTNSQPFALRLLTDQ